MKYDADKNLVDNKNKTALHLEVYYEHSAVMKELLQSKADVNALDNSGKTPLHYASDSCHLVAVKTCFQNDGAGVNMVDRKEISAIH